MVKIPSKTSAKYLEKKFNKSEKYISENILVLDIFFEALNYETIEQKKAYEVAALLGKGGLGPVWGLYWSGGVHSLKTPAGPHLYFPHPPGHPSNVPMDSMCSWKVLELLHPCLLPFFGDWGLGGH
ncbi:hypothetical protein Nmel_018282 [Mimus melanotis]